MTHWQAEVSPYASRLTVIGVSENIKGVKLEVGIGINSVTGGKGISSDHTHLFKRQPVSVDLEKTHFQLPSENQ